MTTEFVTNTNHFRIRLRTIASNCLKPNEIIKLVEEALRAIVSSNYQLLDNATLEISFEKNHIEIEGDHEQAFLDLGNSLVIHGWRMIQLEKVNRRIISSNQPLNC